MRGAYSRYSNGNRFNTSKDVPRSPQFFVPTPIPSQQLENAPALRFENPLQDEHAFQSHFLDSAEGEASFLAHMRRDEQDLFCLKYLTLLETGGCSTSPLS